jgi:hypothetical protein
MKFQCNTLCSFIHVSFCEFLYIIGLFKMSVGYEESQVRFVKTTNWAKYVFLASKVYINLIENIIFIE